MLYRIYNQGEIPSLAHGSTASSLDFTKFAWSLRKPTEQGIITYADQEM